MKKDGFTLIELVIVVAIMSLLMTGMGQIMKLSSEAYSIGIEINDAISGINPVLKRIQKRLVESSEEGLAKPKILDVKKTGEKYTKIKIKLPNESEYWYWYDTEKKIIYRSSSGSEPLNGLNPSSENIPLLRSKNTDWLSKNIKIENFEYEFYKETEDRGKSETWDLPTTVNAINYVKIKVELEGALLGEGKSSNLKFSTGFKIE